MRDDSDDNKDRLENFYLGMSGVIKMIFWNGVEIFIWCGFERLIFL